MQHGEKEKESETAKLKITGPWTFMVSTSRAYTGFIY